MQDVDADNDARLLEPRNSTVPASAEGPHWPNSAAVLEVLAALEVEFKSVLKPPARASD